MKKRAAEILMLLLMVFSVLIFAGMLKVSAEVNRLEEIVITYQSMNEERFRELTERIEILEEKAG